MMHELLKEKTKQAVELFRDRGWLIVSGEYGGYESTLKVKRCCPMTALAMVDKPRSTISVPHQENGCSERRFVGELVERSLTSVHKVSPLWVIGFAGGFDKLAYRTDMGENYADGYQFGREMRGKFLVFC